MTEKQDEELKKALERAAKHHREQAPEHESLRERKAVVKRLVEEEFGAEPTSLERFMQRVKRGEVQPGVGMPLLPPSYRGSEDFYASVRIHVVRHGKALVAAFQQREQAQRWLAWYCAERDADLYEFRIEPVSVMHEVPGGPLFPGFAPSSSGEVS